MSLAGIAMRSTKPGVMALLLVVAMALLLVVAVDAAAQAYPPASLERIEQAPPHVLGFSPPAVREMDLQALDAFAGKRRAEGLRPLERPGPWTLGLLNFQNQLDEDGSGRRLRRTGPELGGQIYVGIHRRF